MPDGLKSPESERQSERLADVLLREPFQASPRTSAGSVAQAPGPAPSDPDTIEEPATPTRGRSVACLRDHDRQDEQEQEQGQDSSPHTSRQRHAAAPHAPCHWAWDQAAARERLRAVARLSGEGALEGFQDMHLAPAAAPEGAEQVGAAAAADSECADRAAQPDGLCWEGLTAGLWAEWEEARGALAALAGQVWERMRQGGAAAEEWAAEVRGALQRMAKATNRACPLWALLSVSGLAVLALSACCSQALRGNALAAQLRQRDRDLARLVVKILHLQDALHSAARSAPLMRPMGHMAGGLETITTTTTLISMA